MNQKPITLLGFDFGTKSIGVAVGQTLTKTARPLLSLKAKDGVPDWDEISRLIKEWKPEALIVGIPLSMDGAEQPIAKAAKRFVNRLRARFRLPVFSADERLTTIEARAKLFEKDGYRAIKKGTVDAISASLILESWMNG